MSQKQGIMGSEWKMRDNTRGRGQVRDKARGRGQGKVRKVRDKAQPKVID